MSNLKKDIEKVLRNLVYTIEAPSSNKGTEFTVSADVSENNVKKIINLIESVVDSVSPSKYQTPTSYKKAIKSKLIGKE